jgi:hypothetical protein
MAESAKTWMGQNPLMAALFQGLDFKSPEMDPFGELALYMAMMANPKTRDWMSNFAQKIGGLPGVNDPMFDYQAAMRDNMMPSAENDNHWSSRGPGGQWYKHPFLHPTANMEWQEIK